MSEISDKFATWGKDDSIIICHRGWSDAICNLCGNGVIALPESRLKAQQTGWHLVCQECLRKFLPDLKTHGGDVKFMGRFKTQAEAEKILPR